MCRSLRLIVKCWHSVCIFMFDGNYLQPLPICLWVITVCLSQPHCLERGWLSPGKLCIHLVIESSHPDIEGVHTQCLGDQCVPTTSSCQSPNVKKSQHNHWATTDFSLVAKRLFSSIFCRVIPHPGITLNQRVPQPFDSNQVGSNWAYLYTLAPKHNYSHLVVICMIRYKP